MSDFNEDIKKEENATDDGKNETFDIGKKYSKRKTNVNFFVDEYKSKMNRKLKFRKKVYEFYNSPITKFWQNFILYLIFLLTFTYVVLVKTPSYPNTAEIIVLTYIFAFGVDKLREVFTHFCAIFHSLWVL